MLTKKQRVNVIGDTFTEGKCMLVKGNFIIRNIGSKKSKVSLKKQEILVHKIEYFIPHNISDPLSNSEYIMYSSAKLGRFVVKLWKDHGDIKIYSRMIDALEEVERRLGKEVVWNQC